MRTALVVVDMQNDFMDGGALPVKGSLALIPIINKTIASLLAHNALIITTQDWHTLDHSQLQPNGGLWPVHCIQNSHGAELADGLILPPETLSVFKGLDKTADGYSGFEGAELEEPNASLENILKAHNITHVYVCGVATDYCVKATALDAAKLGYQTSLINNCIAGVEEGTTDAALGDMAKAGVVALTLN